MSKIVVALGGNALQKNGELTAKIQEEVAKETVQKLIPLIKDGHELVIVHGNGPQVGNLILHEEAGNSPSTPAMPLHVSVGMTQGMIGYWIQKALKEELSKNGISKNATTIITQVEVSKNDQAFKNPTKPIGPFYSEEEAQKVATEKGYVVKEDSGRGWRRVVPSPKPIHILESDAIIDFMKTGAIVIAAGGGGIPVVSNGENSFEGVDAVIDKDFAAELLAEKINADTLLILTGVDNAMINYGKENQQALGVISPKEAEKYINENQFGAGSMLPKIQASLKFAKTGGKAVITSLENAQDAISKNLGTVITQ
ncbi:MAG: carbamate kinase [Candidatus Nanogingivalis sp.]